MANGSRSALLVAVLGLFTADGAIGDARGEAPPAAVVTAPPAADPAVPASPAVQIGVAEILGIAPLRARLRPPGAAATAAERLDDLEARQVVIEALFDAAMSIDAILGRLEREQSEIGGAVDTLRGRSDQTVTTLNIAAILLGSATAVVGTGLQFGDDRAALAGNIIAIGGGLGAALLGCVALVQRAKGRPPQPIHANMLAQFFDRPALPGSEYPPAVWRYLDTPLPGERKSIRRALMEKWTREGRIGGASAEEAAERMELLTSPLPPGRAVPADVLADRNGMLADVEGRVAEMNVAIQRLLAEVRAGK